MRTIICAMCGRRLEVDNRASSAKYCPECRKEAKKARNKFWTEKRKEEEEPYVTDTPENIEKCLNCSLPECRAGSNRCQLYKRKR